MVQDLAANGQVVVLDSLQHRHPAPQVCDVVDQVLEVVTCLSASKQRLGVGIPQTGENSFPDLSWKTLVQSLSMFHLVQWSREFCGLTEQFSKNFSGLV